MPSISIYARSWLSTMAWRSESLWGTAGSLRMCMVRELVTGSGCCNNSNIIRNDWPQWFPSNRYFDLLDMGLTTLPRPLTTRRKCLVIRCLLFKLVKEYWAVSGVKAVEMEAAAATICCNTMLMRLRSWLFRQFGSIRWGYNRWRTSKILSQT